MIGSFRAIILGAPGSGKGTISARIVRKFDITHISSGDLLRNNILNSTKLGLEAKQFIDRGQLVPDEIVTNVILGEAMKHSKNNWLLDGFPRTKDQAESLQKKTIINAALNLVVPLDIIVERIRGRWIHSPSGRVYNTSFNAPKIPGIDDVTGEKLIQREDDKSEAVQRRLQEYESTLGPVINFYKDAGVLEEFHGNTSDEIWPSVYKYLAAHMTPISEDVKL